MFSKIQLPFLTVLKSSFNKAPPKDIFYKNQKKFEEDKFKYELTKRIENIIHSSVLKIEEYFHEPPKLNCRKKYQTILKKKQSLDSSKKGTFKNITPEFLKEVSDIYFDIMRYMDPRHCAKRVFFFKGC